MATQATDGRAVIKPPVPDFITIYAPDGSPHVCAPVDVNEILASGAGYTKEPLAKKPLPTGEDTIETALAQVEARSEQQPEQQSILDDAAEAQAEDGEEVGEKTISAAKRKSKK